MRELMSRREALSEQAMDLFVLQTARPFENEAWELFELIEAAHAGCVVHGVDLDSACPCSEYLRLAFGICLDLAEDQNLYPWWRMGRL